MKFGLNTREQVIQKKKIEKTETQISDSRRQVTPNFQEMHTYWHIILHQENFHVPATLHGQNVIVHDLSPAEHPRTGESFPHPDKSPGG